MIISERERSVSKPKTAFLICKGVFSCATLRDHSSARVIIKETVLFVLYIFRTTPRSLHAATLSLLSVIDVFRLIVDSVELTESKNLDLEACCLMFHDIAAEQHTQHK